MLTSIVRSQLNDRNNDFPFYNERTKRFDCNVAIVSEAVELWNGKKLSSKEVRTLGEDQVEGTGQILAGKVFRSQGMVRGIDFVMLKGEPTYVARDLLKAKWFVCLFIKYDVMRRHAPDNVGDGKYSGAHAIACTDFWRRGVRKTHYIDPLNDGRVSDSLGGKAPQGVQTVPWSAVREAAWAYSVAYEKSQTGLVFGYAVKPR